MNELPLDIENIRKDFPILNVEIFGKPLVYFDNAATTQKPLKVIESLEHYYKEYNSNVHRGVHFLSQKATDAQEAARHTIAQFINAKNDHEVIFTRGTTEGINLIAYSFGKKYLKPGDEVLVTEMEHHSNLVPWQIACEDRGAKLKVIPLNEDGTLNLENLDELLNKNTKILALTWVSNSLGTINPIKEIIGKAHEQHIPVLIDAAQAIQHMPIDVQDLHIDFLVFSGHKIYGPTGIGVLYGKEALLNELPPYQSGGSMIKSVGLEHSSYTDLPFKFEAGTPDVSGAIGLAAAIDYLNVIGLRKVIHAEHELMDYAHSALSSIKGLRFIGNAAHKTGAHSFLVENIHPFDLGELLDKQGIAVRTGHHCCQPIMDRFEIPGTVRASFSFYNTTAEIDKLVLGIEKGIRMLS